MEASRYARIKFHTSTKLQSKELRSFASYGIVLHDQTSRGINIHQTACRSTFVIHRLYEDNRYARSGSQHTRVSKSYEDEEKPLLE